MFQEFFVGKFRRDLALNAHWFDLLETQEDALTKEICQATSLILNAHHIWNCRLQQRVSESELTDTMPVAHWKQLLQANFRETIGFLDDFSAEAKVRYHDSEGVQLEQLTIDLLFQLLQDNAFYRGQLAVVCRQAGIPLPPAELAIIK